MVKKKFIKVLILLGLVLLFYACRELVIQDFSDFDHVPTVNAMLVEGNTLKVNLSLAEKLDTLQLRYVDNADVKLYVNGTFAEQLTYADSGVYYSATIVEPMVEYTCKVDVPGYETIECRQIIPQKPSIINIEHINMAGKDEEGTSYPAVKVTISNAIGEGAYYELEMRLNYYKHEIRTARFHTFVDPVILNEGLPIVLFSNEIINDSVYTLYLNYTTGSSGSMNGGPMRTNFYPFVVELRKVTEEYYRYKKQLYLYEEGLLADGIINGMTNTNVYSNIENGYGVFVGYSAVVSDTITPNTDGYYD